MTDKDLKEAPETPAELSDVEIEDATGGVAPKPGTIYHTPPGVKLE